MLPYLSLAVDGLTDTTSIHTTDLEMRPEDAANDDPDPDTTMPVSDLDPEHLEVYGWESSFWRKVKGYMGL